MEIENLSIQISANARDAIAEIEKLASALGKFNRASRSAADSARDFGDAAKDAGTKTEEAGKRIERIGINIGDFAQRLKAATAPLRSFTAILGKGFGHTFVSASKFFAQLPKQMGGQLVGNIRKATDGFVQFFASIKRIAMYRLIRSALKLITQNISEGIKNLYHWSETADGRFKASIDRITTASKYMGNSFAAMVAPLINSIAPVIDYISDKVVALFNLINQGFARLTGQSTYTVAKKVAQEWDDSSKETKKSISEIKRTILGFDEINKLQSNSNNSGGAGSQQNDYSNLFETRAISAPVSNFVDQIKNAFLAGDWKSLGTMLGLKINEIVGMIDFEGIGRNVGNAINALFTTRYWTLDTINFNRIGESIATFLNNALKRIDFGIVGRSMMQQLTIIGDLVIGFFTSFDWGQAASAISNFIKGLYDELSEWFSKYDWANLGATIWSSLKAFFLNVDYAGLASSFFGLLGNAIRGAAMLLGGFFGSIAQDIKIWWDKDIKGKDWTETAGNLLSAIGTGLGNVGQWAITNIVDPIANALLGEDTWSNVKTELSGMWSDLGAKATEIFGTIKNVIVAAWSGITTWTTSMWNTIRNVVANTWDWLSSNVTGAFDTIKNVVVAAWSGITTWTTSMWNSIKNFATNIWNGLTSKATEIFGNIKNTVVNAWSSVTTWTTSTWNSLKNNVANIWDNIKTNASTTFTNITNNIKDAWSNIQRGFASFVSWIRNGFWSDWGTAWSGIVEHFSRIFAKIKDKVKDPINAVIKFLNKLISKVESAINKIVSGINSALSISIPAIGFWDPWGNWRGTSAWSWSPNLPGVSWDRINELARGGILDSPTMLTPNTLAGEAGREAVLPLENHTEWMDTLANRVRNGISGQDGNLAESVRQGMSEAVSRQNDLLREQNRLLQQLLAKDMTVEVTSTAINKAQNRMNKRAGTTIVPVGT